MPHRRSSFAVVIWAFLCLGMLVLWARSYVVSDSVDWSTASGRAGLSSLDGRLAIGRVSVSSASMSRIPRGLSYRSEPAEYAQSVSLRPGWSSWFGFQATDVNQPGLRATDVRIPYWFISLLVLFPMAWLIVRHHRQSRPGRCPTCGYDLRATPARCPECGIRLQCPRPQNTCSIRSSTASQSGTG